MRVAIIGAGAIGSVVAAWLTKAGEDVVLVGRETQVKAIEASGLKVVGARGEEMFKIKALTRLDQECDLAILTVKTQDIDEAAESNREFLKNSMILSSQNGVRADEFLKKYFPEEHLFSSIVMFGATYTQPGGVTFNFEGDWVIGKPFGAANDKTREIADLLKVAFPIVVSDDLIGMKWLKLFINFNNCIPAVIGKSMQETYADMDLCRLSVLLSKEGVGIMQKAGINMVSLPSFPSERIIGLTQMPVDQAAGIINKTLTALSKEPLYGSILQSIMRKRTSEIDYINGEIVRLAGEGDREAPLNAKIVELVHQVEKNEKFFDPGFIKDQFGLKTKVMEQ